MKFIKALLSIILMLLAMMLGVFLPVIAIGYGLITLLIEDPKLIFQLLLIYGALFSLLWGIFKLTEHPKTKAITQTILWMVAIMFFIHSCSTYRGSADGCAPSRYITCD
jgi:hypothetical protein